MTTFQDIFKSSFLENVTSVSLLDMGLALILAFGLGLFIFLVYKKTFSGVMYSSSFGVTLVALTMITTMVILAVTSNVVLSLGMVGALSIVRFRTAIKEPLDIAFLFWSIAVGIVLAAGMIPLAVIGSVVIGVMLIVFVNRKSHCDPYMVVLQCGGHSSEVHAVEFLRQHARRYVVKSKTVQKDAVELNLEVRLKDENTGSMVHNYYLYEKDGQLSMIPWDYNLAYGTFQGSSASSAVNAPIDTPVSGGDSRPMLDWIFDSEEYTALYHQYFQEFLETVDIPERISSAAELIAPYVKKDPTAFYTYEEFQTGVEALQTFCRLRAESVSGQLDGTIPSTMEGQSEDASRLIDAFSLTLSDMGTMNHGGGFGGPNGGGDFRMPGRNGVERFSPENPLQETASFPSGQEASSIPSGQPSVASAGSDANPFSPGGLRQGQQEKFGNGFSGERGGGFPGEPETEAPAAGGTVLISIIVSSGVLLAGLLFALLYRRRGQ